MTTVRYFIFSVIRSRLFYITTAVVMMIIIVMRVVCVPTYRMSETALYVYPSEMFNGGMSKVSINPCYKVRRSLESHEFRRYMIDRSDGLLTEGNIRRLMRIYETPQHLMTIHLYSKDTTATLSLLGDAAIYIKQRLETYPSSVIEQVSGGMTEGVVSDYNWDLADTAFVIDEIDSPYVVSTPSLVSWVLLIICSLLFSMGVAATLTLLVSAFARNIL